MIIVISDEIMVNTDHIVTIEKVKNPSDFKSEVRITLVGRMGNIVATGEQAEKIWEWFKSDYYDVVKF